MDKLKDLEGLEQKNMESDPMREELGRMKIMQQAILDVENQNKDVMRESLSNIQKAIDEFNGSSYSPVFQSQQEDVSKFTGLLVEKIEMIDVILDQIGGIKEDVGEIKDVQKTNHRTYAQVIKSNGETVKDKTDTKKEKYRGIPKPKLYLQAAENIDSPIEFIKDKIDPTINNIRIDGIKNLNSKTSLIVTKTCEDMDRLVNELDKNPDIKNNITYRKARERNPKIILYDIEDDIQADELIDKLTQQNEIFTKENIRVDFKIKSKYGNHWVLTLVPSVYKVLGTFGSIYLGWRSISFKEFLSPKQCSTCSRYGHTAHTCRHRGECPECHVEHPKEVTCKDDSIGCINCKEYNNKFNKNLETDHSVKSKNCKIRMEEINRLIRITNYGS